MGKPQKAVEFNYSNREIMTSPRPLRLVAGRSAIANGREVAHLAYRPGDQIGAGKDINALW